MTNLFKSGTFKLHSGGISNFKIDCDALAEEDWKTIATIIHAHVRFCTVIGVPAGGLKLAYYLHPGGSSNPNDPVLIVDDVLTTGTSMEELKAVRRATSNYLGVVVFARGSYPDWIYTLEDLMTERRTP